MKGLLKRDEKPASRHTHRRPEEIKNHAPYAARHGEGAGRLGQRLHLPQRPREGAGAMHAAGGRRGGYNPAITRLCPPPSRHRAGKDSDGEIRGTEGKDDTCSAQPSGRAAGEAEPIAAFHAQ